MPANGQVPAIPPPSAVDRAAYASLRPVVAFLSVLYAVFAIAHPMLLPREAVWPMTLIAAMTAAICAGLYGVLRAGTALRRWPHATGLVIAGLVLLNSLAHLDLVGDARDTTNLLLLIVGAGFLLLSSRWLVLCIAVSLAGWLLVAWAHPPFSGWARFIFALASASVLAAIVHRVRLKTVVELEQFQIDLERLVDERTTALAQERNLLRTLVNSLPDGVFVKDAAGRYRIANLAHRQHLGLEPGLELVDRTWGDLMPGDSAARETSDERRLLEAGEAWLNRELRITTATGSTRWLLTSRIPVRDEAGAITGLVGVSRDVTQAREEEQARRRLDQQLQDTQRLESLGVLAGGIAHDFNNLLTGVLGNIGLARRGVVRSTPIADCLDRMETAATRATDLCQQMLAYAGKGHFAVQRLDLGALVTDLAPLLQLSIDKRVRLRIDVAPSLPAVLADPAQLRQVLMNLVINASDALSGSELAPLETELAGRGTISIRIGTSAPDRIAGRILVAAAEPSPVTCVSLEVRDDGHGMTEDTLSRIFEPFFTTKFTGRGLGLAVVHGIVRRHQGALAVQTAINRGTSFTMLLPAIAEPAAPLASLRNEPSAWRGAGAVLLVDDEQVVREVTAAMLVELGFDVVSASDGQQGVERFAETPDGFVFVLLDLTMPTMNGQDALREIRRLRPQARVLMMSGYNEEDAAGPTSSPIPFMHKPFTFAELCEHVERLLQ